MAPHKKTLKNIARVVPGESKTVSGLRAKTINALKTWESSQKSRHRSKHREIMLKRNAANALEKYSKAILDEEEAREHIGTARNKTNDPPLPTNERMLRRLLNSNSTHRRVNKFSNEANKGLRGVGLNENVRRMFDGGRRRTRRRSGNKRA
jgi:hypothetical protein